MSKASEDWHYLKIKEVLAPIHLLLGSTSWYLPALAYASDRHVTDVVSVMSCVMFAVCLSLELYVSISEHSREFISIIIEININQGYIINNNLIIPIFCRALIYYRIIIIYYWIIIIYYWIIIIYYQIIIILL